MFRGESSISACSRNNYHKMTFYTALRRNGRRYTPVQ